MERFQALEQSAIFQGLTHSEIESILPCVDASIHEYKKGAIVFTPGECTDRIVLVLTGIAKVSANLNANAESTMEYLRPGQSFGVAHGVLGQTPAVTMRAAEPCQLLFLNCTKLITPCVYGCAPHPTVVRNLLFELATIVQHQAEKVDYLHYQTLRAKLASYLLNNGKQTPDTPFEIPMTKTTLSEYLGISRSSMVRELSNMQKLGMISFNRSTFVLHDIKSLQTCLEQ